MKKLYFIIALVVVVIFASYATDNNPRVSNFEKYERYFDSLDQVIYGNYHLIQPGLYDILNQMPKDAGQPRINKDHWPPVTAFPMIFSAKLSPNLLSKKDTLKYNPVCDTILCKNSLTIEDSYAVCVIISTLDTMKVYDICSKEPLFTHGLVMDSISKSKYIDLIKNWDNEKIAASCPTFKEVSYPNINICISRLIIQDGKLTDIKYRNCADMSL